MRALFVVVLLAFCLFSCRTRAQTQSTVTGFLSPLEWRDVLNFPFSITVDEDNNLLYIADVGNYVIRVYDNKMSMNIVAGSKTRGYSGDNGFAQRATFLSATGISIDSRRNEILITDMEGNAVRAVHRANGLIKTVVGGPSSILSDLHHPSKTFYDAGMDIVFIADKSNNCIKEWNRTSGLITVFAGNGSFGYSGDNGQASLATLYNPFDVCADLNKVYICDSGNNVIRVVDRHTAIISTLAGTGVPGSSGDFGLATQATFNNPNGLAIDGNLLYIADSGNNRVRAVNLTSMIIMPVAGTGIPGYSGDNGKATDASLFEPLDISIDSKRNLLYIADANNNAIRVVNRTTGIITNALGITHNTLGYTSGITIDEHNNVYLSQMLTKQIISMNRISGVKTVIAGNGTEGLSGDGIPATSAMMRDPHGLAFDTENNQLYFADIGADIVKRVNLTSGTIHIFAGNGIKGLSGDGSLAINAMLDTPTSPAFDPTNKLLYICDTFNNKIRVVNPQTGIITTFAGTGISGRSGDDGPATEATLYWPGSVAVDVESDQVFIADSYNHQIRVVDRKTGIISLFAGNGNATFSGDGGLASEAGLYIPLAIALDQKHRLLFIADTYNVALRVVHLPSRIITSIDIEQRLYNTLYFDESSNSLYLSDILGNIQTFIFTGCNFGSFGEYPCKYCPKGTYSDIINGATCTPCDISLYSEVVGATLKSACIPCPLGYFGNHTGSSTCYPCPAGTFRDSYQKTACSPCPKGHVTKEDGKSFCTPCNPGTFANSLGTQCIPCPIGYFRNSSDVFECQLCPEGHTAETVGAVACSICPAGTFYRNGTKCQPCNLGTYTNFTGQLSCLQCAPGYFASQYGSTQCDPCIQGTYSTVKGAIGNSVCLPCGISHESSEGSTACKINWVFPVTISIILLASVVLLIIICIIAHIGVKKYRKYQESKVLHSLLTNQTDSLELEIPITTISFNELSDFKEIGSGSSGALVLKGKWRKQDVVVKLFKSQEEDHGNSEVIHELQVMISLNHPNITSIFGACFNTQRIGFVMEFCENGSLKTFMKSNQGKLSWNDKIRLLLDVARGMQYLHSKGIIHRDLKSDNILIDRNRVAKLADFGVAKIATDSKASYRVGTSNYMAPEIVNNEFYDEKCDVFSFAIVMFEVLTEDFEPYGGKVHVEVCVAKNPLFRPNFPDSFQFDNSQMQYVQLMTTCWSHLPSQRPVFTDIIANLAGLG